MIEQRGAGRCIYSIHEQDRLAKPELADSGPHPDDLIITLSQGPQRSKGQIATRSWKWRGRCDAVIA
jgi:hypothetical protein